MSNSSGPVPKMSGTTPVPVLRTIGYLSTAFIVLFTIAFLSALFFMGASIGGPRPIFPKMEALDHDLEGIVQQHTRPRNSGLRVADPPRSDQETYRVDY